VTEKRKRKTPLGQSIGGVLFGFEQQVFRNQPPPHELVHHARPDDPIAAGDGTLVTFELPTDPDEPAERVDPADAAHSAAPADPAPGR